LVCEGGSGHERHQQRRALPTMISATMVVKGGKGVRTGGCSTTWLLRPMVAKAAVAFGW